MQTDSLNGRIALVSLLTILLMPHTLADDSRFTNSQYPNDDYDLSSSGSLGDPSAGPFGNLLISNGPKIDSSWATDNAGLKLNSNPQDENPESPLMADKSIPCPNLSRPKQSRRGKRGKMSRHFASGQVLERLRPPHLKLRKEKPEEKRTKHLMMIGKEAVHGRNL